MITEKDIKNLKFFDTKFAKFVYYFVIIIPFFWLIMGGLNLQLASKLGDNAGYSLSELFNAWSSGIDLQKNYSGRHLMAIQRLQTSLTNFAFAVVCTILPFVFNKVRKRNKRILITLIHHEILK